MNSQDKKLTLLCTEILSFKFINEDLSDIIE